MDKHTEEKSQSRSDLNDELHKICPEVSHNAADSHVNKTDDTGDDDTDPERHACEAIKQQTDRYPLGGYVKKLGADASESDKQLCSSVIAHLKVFGDALDSERSSQARPARSHENCADGHRDSDYDCPPEVDGDSL